MSVGLLVASAGCGDDEAERELPEDDGRVAPAEVPPVDMCDGTDGIVLAAQSFCGFCAGNAISERLGDSFLFVTGDCRAYTSRTAGEVYEQQLSDSQARGLGVGVGYGLWPQRYGSHGLDDPIDDAGTVLLTRPEGVVGCLAGCERFQMDPVLQTFSWYADMEALERAGRRLTGPARVLATEGGSAGDLPEWPAGLPTLASLTATSGPEAEVGYILPADQAEAIRSYRNALDHPAQQRFGQDGRAYYLVFRDLLPFEDDQGRVFDPQPLPGPRP